MKPFRRSLKTGLLLAPVVDVLGLADGTLDAAGLDQAHLWRHEQRALELLSAIRARRASMASKESRKASGRSSVSTMSASMPPRVSTMIW